MINVQYHGHSCFRIQFGDGLTVITDPYTKVGYELPKGLQADVVTVSHGHFDHNYVAAISCETILTTAAPCRMNGVTFEGITTYHDPEQGKLRGLNTVFKFSGEGITICHLGDLGEACSQALLDEIGKVDVLLIPVGGTYTIDAKQAREYIDKIAPKIAIPMHYRPIDGALDIAESKAFLDLVSDLKRMDFLNGEAVINRDLLTNDKTQIFYLERMR